MSSKCSLVFVLIILSTTVCSGRPINGSTSDSEEMTAFPRHMLDEALNVDDGVYSTQAFHYQNAQKDTVAGDYNDTCIDSYIDCIQSQTIKIEVCAQNVGDGIPDDKKSTNTWNAPSYCDVYLDNCRRGYRVWRILNRGVCRKATNPVWNTLEGRYTYPKYIRERERFDPGPRMHFNDTN